MDKLYQQAYPVISPYWVQAAIDKRFKVGDQSLNAFIYGDNNYWRARKFFFNLIKRHVSMIAGYQRKNRKSTITVPLNEGDKLSDQYNEVLSWAEERDGFQEYFSQSFENALDVGINFLHMYPDYTQDPVNGDLLTDSVSYCNVMWDPYFRKADLSDCNFIWRRRWVTKDQAKSLLPTESKEIDRLRPASVKDGRFPLQAELMNINVNNLMTYDEFHYKSTREATFVIDPKTGEASEWEEDEDSEEHLKQILMFQPWLIVKKQKVPTVKLAIVISGQVMYNGPNLLNVDMYPFVPHLCYHDPDIQTIPWRLQGVVRNLRDSQYLYNMRKVIELDILQSQINSGWIYSVDALTDPKALRQSGQGFLVPLKAGHLPNEVQRIEPPSIPQSMIELSNALAEDITKISGVNEELLGSATDDKAGILAMLRQSGGLTTLQNILDKSDFTQRLYGKLRLHAIRKNFSKGKVESILQAPVDEAFFSSRSLKYSLAVEEGNYTTTQRQQSLQQLLYFKELGMPIPDEAIIKAAFIPDKMELIQSMQQSQEQQQQQMQAQQQQQQQKDQVEAFAKTAKAKSDLALEKERLATTMEKQTNVSNIAADAEHKQLQSDYELVKMMVELENMDLQQIKNSLEIAERVKMANEVQENTTIIGEVV